MTRRPPTIHAKRRCFVRRYKTAMCNALVTTGHCPFGFDCLFAHTESELRTEEMNIAQGVTDSVIAMWVAKKKRESAQTSDASSAASSQTSVDSQQSAVDALRHSLPRASCVEGGKALRRLWRVANEDGLALQRLTRRRARNRENAVAPRSNPYQLGGAGLSEMICCWAVVVESDSGAF